ncbi:pyridoxal phosphate-dependent aminotransferase [Qipengyuania sp.]|uniref:pyridoxal phosphate-dependent aminotransferase n=1 Tax=Qipengyuania sp. TaxID=2004515 RepID=UPI0035C875CF
MDSPAAISSPRPVPKPWIETIHAYVPGKSAGREGKPLVKLSANENPLGCSPAARAALAAPADPARYPDPDATELRLAIGALHQVDPARIVCGTGSGELLHCAVQAFAGEGDEVVMPRHSFSLYPLLANKVGATPIFADMAGDTASVDALLGAVTANTRVVLLDNPNNPMGSFVARDEVARLHAGLPGDVLLILDQAYAEYIDDPDPDGALALAATTDNVLVTRTFSKAYGLAAARVGWATGAAHLIDMVNRLRGAFNVNAAGLAAARAAIGDQNFVASSRDHNRRELDRFEAAIAALGNHGLSAVPSQANFSLVRFAGPLTAASALEALAAGGYAVRHLPSQGLGDALRITIGSRSDMEAVTEILAAAAEKA